MAGLWGSGNTVTERELLPTDENTVYTTWTGEGILGPREGVALDRYPALWGRILWAEFVDRYAYLPDEDCRVFTGDEILGIGCDVACAAMKDRCDGEMTEPECLALCSTLPRSSTTCLERLDTCDPVACGLPVPE